MIFLQIKQKKQQKEAERYMDVMMSNLILLRHLAEIAMSKRVDDGKTQKKMHWKVQNIIFFKFIFLRNQNFRITMAPFCWWDASRFRDSRCSWTRPSRPKPSRWSPSPPRRRTRTGPMQEGKGGNLRRELNQRKSRCSDLFYWLDKENGDIMDLNLPPSLKFIH